MRILCKCTVVFCIFATAAQAMSAAGCSFAPHTNPKPFAGVYATSAPTTLTRAQNGFLIIQSDTNHDITLPATTAADVGTLTFTICPGASVTTSKLYPANGEQMLLANWDTAHAYARAAEGKSFTITLFVRAAGLWGQLYGPNADGTLGWNPQD